MFKKTILILITLLIPLIYFIVWFTTFEEYQQIRLSCYKISFCHPLSQIFENRKLSRLPDLTSALDPFYSSLPFQPSVLPVYYLKVDPADYQSIINQLPVPYSIQFRNTPSPKISGELSYNGKNYKVDFSFRGIGYQHWSEPKKSLRVAIKSGETLEGLDEIDLIVPSDSNYYGFFLNKWSADYLGLYANEPSLIHVYLNNIDYGPFVKLDRWNKSFLEIRGIPNGLIFIDEDAAFRCNNAYGIWGPAITPLLDTEIAKQNPVVVGYPYKLEFKSPTQIHKLSNDTRQKLRIKNEEKVILILGSFPIAVTRFFSIASTYSFVNLVVKGVADTGNKWNIIIRSHPSNSPNWLEQIPVPPSIRIIADNRQLPLNEAVAASDFVISNLTTAILEPMIQNKPHLLYLFENPEIVKRFPHPLVAGGAVIPFQTSSQLTKTLSSDPDIIASRQTTAIKKFLRDYCSLPAKISTPQKLYNIIHRELAT